MIVYRFYVTHKYHLQRNEDDIIFTNKATTLQIFFHRTTTQDTHRSTTNHTEAEGNNSCELETNVAMTGGTDRCRRDWTNARTVKI